MNYGWLTVKTSGEYDQLTIKEFQDSIEDLIE
jgi:hypothetical protein